MSLHLPTLNLALMAAFGLLLLLYTLAGQRWLPQGEVRLWGLLGLALLATTAVTAFAHRVPAGLVAGAGALALGAGVVSLVTALMRFVRQPLHKWRLALAFVAFCAVVVANRQDDPAQRAVWVSLAFGGLVLPLAWSVHRHGWRAERALRAVILMLWLLAAMALWRGAHASLDPLPYRQLPMAPLEVVLPYAAGLLALLGVAFGYVLAAQERAHNRLKRLASRDALTGLANRRTYETRRARALAQLQRSADPLSLALIDIDDFKRINDQHGHAVGDEALRHLAKVLKPRLRQVDTLARWGGEEFALLLPATPRSGALHLMRALRLALKEQPLTLASGQRLVLSMSIGWITLPAASTPPATERLMRALDLAMYEVKQSGKDGEREAQLDDPGTPSMIPLHELPDTDNAKL